MVLCHIGEHYSAAAIAHVKADRASRAELLSGLVGLAIVRPVTGGPTTRYAAPTPPDAADGWRLDRLTAPSRLFGANGLRTGPDGRIYIAQVTGSQISALDLGTGEVETVSAKGGDIVAPDDVAFDSRRQPRTPPR